MRDDLRFSVQTFEYFVKSFVQGIVEKLYSTSFTQIIYRLLHRESDVHFDFPYRTRESTQNIWPTF